ncbi:DUF924 family protein [Sneathiella chinensis]|nr:DUF924 family protein [Sneathiella chinensis]
MSKISEILDFWFLPEDHPDHGENRPEWFQKNEAFDQEIRDRFLDDFEKAVNGDYLSWATSMNGCLALILLFDQFSRNMFRDSPKAFSADAKAREIARHMIREGYSQGLPAFKRNFAILPFEHSEDLSDQEYSVALFREFSDESSIDFAVRHLEIIKRFGRFPHRNQTLGRSSTPEEADFLQQPNSSF